DAQPVQPRHRDIQHEDVGLGFLQHLQGFFAVVGAADHLDVLLRVEKLAQRRTKLDVVVRDQHANQRRPLPGTKFLKYESFFLHSFAESFADENFCRSAPQNDPQHRQRSRRSRAMKKPSVPWRCGNKYPSSASSTPSGGSSRANSGWSARKHSTTSVVSSGSVLQVL